jgi:hypothetical protein
MRITRRKFVISSLATLPLVWLGYAGFRSDYRDIIFETVRRSLPDLDLDLDGLKRYSNDFALRFPKSSLRTGLLSTAIHLQRVPFVSGIVNLRLKDFRTLVSELFLLSSDYFVHERTTQDQVHYIKFYDPYERPCTNPLARFN